MAITKVDPLTRIEKGSALSYLEMDTNFTGAATAINELIVQGEDLDTRLTEAETRIEELPAEVDAAGTAATLIAAHNSSSIAHPELSAFITSEADRAEAAADAAELSGGVFQDTAAGLAAVAEGEYFSVPSLEDNEYLILYRNISSVAVEIKKYPSVLAVKLLTPSSKNIFNIDDPDAAIDFRPNNTTGNLLSTAGYNTSGFIPVQEGLAYSLSSKDYQCWYDENKAFISGTTNSTTAVTSTAPAGAAFMRVSAKTSSPNLWSGLQVEQSPVQTVYAPYGDSFNSELFAGESVDGAAIKSGTIPMTAPDFLMLGKNLYNKDSATIGYYVNGTTGTMVASATYNTSALIPVVGGETYYGAGANPSRFHAYYDSKGNFVLGGSNSSASTFVVPANASFIKISIFAVDQDVFQFELGASPTSFEPYGYNLLDPTGAPIFLMPTEQSIDEEMVADEAITPRKTNFLRRSKNLFNKATVTEGFFLSATGGLTANATFNVSDYIEITPATQYWGQSPVSGIRMYCYFNAAFTVVTGGSNTNSSTFTPPSGTKYVRITVYAADQDLFQLEIGSAASSFEPYGYNFGLADNTPINLPDSSVSNWRGLTIDVMGDSNVGQNKWQPLVVNGLGVTLLNHGVGGSKIAKPDSAVDQVSMCDDVRIAALSATADAYAVLGGTNDWAQSVAIGTITDTVNTTFYGAYKQVIEKILTLYPTKRLYLITPFYSEYSGPRSGEWADGLTNGAGHKVADYAEAVRMLGKRYGLSVIDFYSDAGFNEFNCSSYLLTEGSSPQSRIHLNTGIGAETIARAFVNRIEALQPLTLQDE